MKVIFFKDHDGSIPVKDWLEKEVARRDIRIAAKCRVRIEMLQRCGRMLRRPSADYLRDHIYELRISYGTMNYRILYFLHGNEAVVLTNGLVKEACVSVRDIDLAIQRRRIFLAEPERHTYDETE